VIQTLT